MGNYPNPDVLKDLDPSCDSTCGPVRDKLHTRQTKSARPVKKDKHKGCKSDRSTKTKGNFSSENLLGLEVRAFLDLCVAVNTPRSLACYLLAKSGEWAQYIGLTRPDQSQESFPDDYLVSECMRKNPRIDIGVNRCRVAQKGWIASERQNRTTNVRISSRTQFTPEGEIRVLEDAWLDQVLNRIRRLIRRVLPPLTPTVVDEIVHKRAHHGPGATSTIAGRDVSRGMKNISEMGVTPALWPLRESVSPIWQDETVGFLLQRYDTWINVPKNARTDRGICIGPGLNMYLQLGVGDYIRDRLKIFAVDIRNGQQRHRWLVGIAERLGLSTLDLSAASDSIAIAVIQLLFPREWYHLLSMLRTSHTRIKGIEVEAAKFSAMGNGYTFELETLLFWAIATAVDEQCVIDGVATISRSRFVSAYGDDLIIQQSAYTPLVRTLAFLGFRVNKEKSFPSGNFFESCGSDVWKGKDVRPIYFDGEYTEKTQAVIELANAVRIYARRRGMTHCDRRFLRTWLNVVKCDSKAQKTAMPITWERRTSRDIERRVAFSAASGLIRNFDEATPDACNGLRHSDMNTWDGFLGTMWYQRPNPFRTQNDLYPAGLYVASIMYKSPLARVAYLAGESEGTTEYARRSVCRGRLKRTICPTWSDIGPWA